MEILRLFISLIALVLAFVGLFIVVIAPFNAKVNIFAKSWRYYLMMFVFWVVNTISATVNIAYGTNVTFNWFMVIMGIFFGCFYYYQATVKARPDLDAQVAEYKSREKLKNDHRPISITGEGEFIYEDEEPQEHDDHYYQS